MKFILFISITSFLFAQSPFETPKSHMYDLSTFETKRTVVNEKAMENEKIKCRYVCDKKIYKEQKIADAVSFYKKSSTLKRN